MNGFKQVLDLELVRTLAVIVDTGGFTEAAKRLYRTQSAISMQIKRLEDSLGAKLLHRNRSRVVLRLHP